MEAEIELWCNKILAKLRKKSRLQPSTHCLLWTGCLKKTKGRGGDYGRMNVLVPGCHSRTRMSVHRLAYIVHTKNLTISQQYDVSHLCHNSLCVNFDHLSLEPHSVNNARKTCRKQKACTGHGPHPECMGFTQSARAKRCNVS